MVVISLAVWLRSDDTGARIGIALNMVLVTNTTLLRLVESWTSLEISIGAIARLKALQHATPCEETSFADLVPDRTWPSRGSLDLNNVEASYEYVCLQKCDRSEG
jgi:ATP-binding cassette subfamily C (CFTR/MRP) protein 1